MLTRIRTVKVHITRDCQPIFDKLEAKIWQRTEVLACDPRATGNGT
jgi:hypothetical protein